MERILFTAEEGSITEAAKKLYVSQPTLSLMITSVEKELGFKIFDRRAHSLQLTEPGQKYIDTVKTMLNLWGSFNNEVKNIKQGIVGTITIGISQRRSIAMLPKLIQQFVKSFPLINLKIVDCVSSVSETLLSQGAIDIAFGHYPTYSEKTTNIRLNSEYLFIVAHKDSSFAKKHEEKRYINGSFRKKAISIEEAKDEKFIILNTPEDERVRYENIIKEAQIVPFAPIEVFISRIAESFVEQNIGLALLPKIFTRDMKMTLRNDNLSYFVIDSVFATRKFYMSYDNSINLTEAHKGFIDMVIDMYGQNVEFDT